MANGRPEHAHVGVHAHHDHVLDAPLLHEIDGLGAVGDGVGRLDLESRDLARPRAALLAVRLAIAAAVGVVDRQMAFAFAIDAAALFERDLGRDVRSPAGPFALLPSLRKTSSCRWGSG